MRRCGSARQASSCSRSSTTASSWWWTWRRRRRVACPGCGAGDAQGPPVGNPARRPERRPGGAPALAQADLVVSRRRLRRAHLDRAGEPGRAPPDAHRTSRRVGDRPPGHPRGRPPRSPRASPCRGLRCGPPSSASAVGDRRRRAGEAAERRGFDETVMQPARRRRRHGFVSAVVDVAIGHLLDVFEGRHAGQLRARIADLPPSWLAPGAGRVGRPAAARGLPRCGGASPPDHQAAQPARPCGRGSPIRRGAGATRVPGIARGLHRGAPARNAATMELPR